jgi:hypothetical protein
VKTTHADTGYAFSGAAQLSLAVSSLLWLLTPYGFATGHRYPHHHCSLQKVPATESIHGVSSFSSPLFMILSMRGALRTKN